MYDDNMLYNLTQSPTSPLLPFLWSTKAFLYGHEYDPLTCATASYQVVVEIDTSTFTSGLIIVNI